MNCHRALLFLLVAVLVSSSLLADRRPGYVGRRLVDVLQELRDQGLDVVFSSAVVEDGARVTVEPSSSIPRRVLEQILPSMGLRAADGPSDSVLILPATPSGKLHGRVVSDVELQVELIATPSFVTEIVVTPSRHSVVRRQQDARHTVTRQEALLAPTIGGDVTRVIELLPGVAAADGSAAFNVRGSLARDVSMVLDGLELYDPFHLQSFQSPFSLIDTNIVDRIDFFGGGFTADFGDRHGGFVDISTLVPEVPARGELELGTLNSRLSYRAPGTGGSSSWLISARGWYPQAVTDTTEIGRGEQLDPRFEDLYAKAEFGLGRRHRLSAHALLAYDRVRLQETGETLNENVNALTRNGYGWLRLLSVWSDDLMSETVVSGGRIERIRNGVSAESDGIEVRDQRSVGFVGLKNDTEWRISDARALKLGVDLRRLDGRYRYSNVAVDEPSSSSTIRLDPGGLSLGAYVAHRARVLPALAAEVGLRWDRQTYTGDNQLSPRFNAVWQPARRTELRLAAGRFNQSQRIHELEVSDGETGFSRAEVAREVELSFRYTFRRGLRLRLDAYDTRLSDLRPRYENLFEPIELFPETTADRVRIDAERARLQGLEMLLSGSAQRPWFWSVGYTLSSADDRIDGVGVPRSWDQTHSARFLVGYRRDDRWSLSLSGTAHTGWPTTPISAEVVTTDGSTEFEAVRGARNSIRLDRYARVDLKARRSFRLPGGRVSLTFEVVNLTDRANACCIDEVLFTERPAGGADVTRTFDYWLGFTPSFGVLWEF